MLTMTAPLEADHHEGRRLRPPPLASFGGHRETGYSGHLLVMQ
jgi:hypothetical protein